MYLFVNCENQETANLEGNYKIEAKGFLEFNRDTGKISIINTKKTEDKSNIHQVSLSFVSKVELPILKYDKELIEFISEHQNEMNGIIFLKIDDEIVYSVEVINGVKRDKGETMKKNIIAGYPCSVNGLSKCTQDRVRNMNFLDTTLCIVAGFECVAVNYASCAVDNCF